MAAVSCPICGHRPKKDECSHFLGEFDHTFGEVIAGPGLDSLTQLDEMIHKCFKSKRALPLFEIPELRELYDQWQKTGSIDKFIFSRLLVGALKAAGAQKAVWFDSEDDETHSSPGFCSSATLLYADSPGAVIQAACKNILAEISQHG